MILTIIGVTAGCIILAISMFNLGKKKYEVNLDVDVKGIIDEAVNNFLQEHEPVQCNHKWSVFKEYGLENSNSEIKSMIIVQKCENCGELKEIRINA